MKIRRQRGFTIVEIVIVVIIISILATLTVVMFTQAQKDARDKKRDNDVRLLVQELQKYYSKNAMYPYSCNVWTTATCASGTSAYTSGVGYAPISVIDGAATTVSGLQTLMSGIGTEFGDPQDTSGTPINRKVTSTDNISRNSYFLLSQGAENRTGTVYLSTDDASAASRITCNFTANNNNSQGAAQASDGRAHYIVVGYFSESQNKWVFYSGPFTLDLVNTQWNSSSNADCTTTASIG